jgi:hypothetical protein
MSFDKVRTKVPQGLHVTCTWLTPLLRVNHKAGLWLHNRHLKSCMWCGSHATYGQLNHIYKNDFRAPVIQYSHIWFIFSKTCDMRGIWYLLQSTSSKVFKFFVCLWRKFTNLWRRVARTTAFCTTPSNTGVSLNMKLASSDTSDAYNFERVTKFLENLCTP